MVDFSGAVVLGVMALGCAAVVAGHFAQRLPMSMHDEFPSTIALGGPTLFRIEPMEGGAVTDCSSVAELEQEVRLRKGQVLRVLDLRRNEEEYVQVMDDGSTWYPWASRHRIHLELRFRD